MILADFKLSPLKGSKYFFRIRIFDTQENMEAVAVADGSMTGKAQACFCGATDRTARQAGDVYLWDAPTLRLDAVHELTHAAVHYVRAVRKGDLSIPNNGEYASTAEELLCRTMEQLLGGFFGHYNEWVLEGGQRRPVQPPAGYSAEELDRDNPYNPYNPYNAWVQESS